MDTEELQALGGDSFFMQSGNRFSLTNERSTKIHNTLPLGVYEVQLHPMMGYYLTPKEQRAMPPKLYGSVKLRGQRILRSYRERSALGLPTGVLLTGEKGSGKTLLARYLMEECNLPTVIVSAPFCDSAFLELLTAGGRKLVLFDEFEKVYADKGAQSALLGMLDGHYNTNNLTVATLNDSYALIDALKNRPSRFYYHYRYTSIERAFIEEYCHDKLHDCTTDKIMDVFSVTTRVFGFNFDMLQALVEEMNRFGDPAQECMKHINIIPTETGYTYAVKAFDSNGNELKLSQTDVRVERMDPIRMDFGIVLEKRSNKNDDGMVWVDGSAHYVNTTLDGEMVFDAPSRDGKKVRVVLKSKFKNLQWAV